MSARLSAALEAHNFGSLGLIACDPLARASMSVLEVAQGPRRHRFPVVDVGNDFVTDLDVTAPSEQRQTIASKSGHKRTPHDEGESALLTHVMESVKCVQYERLGARSLHAVYHRSRCEDEHIVRDIGAAAAASRFLREAA
jgi:hypothetical protein